MSMNGAKVYSYTRFSDPKQALGHSADRQLQYAKAWAAKHDLVLDDTLSMKDEGLSAFHQKHIKQGALTEALLAGESDGATPMIFVRKARELEEQHQVAKGKVQQAERELVNVAARQVPADARLWSDLTEGVDNQEVEAREKVRQLVMDTFERIVIYIRGVVPEERKYIDVLLIANSGQRRWMRIERRTGVWAAGADRPF
jgi:hypothetical protein